MKLPSISLNRTLPIHIGIIITFLLIPIWYRFKGLPPSFGSFGIWYSLGFIIFWPMLWTVIWWIIAGFPGLKDLIRDRVRLVWASALLLLAGWAFFSWIWGYTRASHPEVTIGSAIPFGLAALFAFVIACIRPPARRIALLLVIGLVWNGIIAAIQVAIQGSIDLAGAGFRLNPQASGTSVVEAEGIRWLRPYALLPHPNILAGLFAVCLLAVLVWMLSSNLRARWIGTLIFLFGLWCLLLTFSRSAWMGFAAGAFALLPYLMRTRLKVPQIRRHFILTIGISLLAAVLFAYIYRPFLSARAGLGDVSSEQRSISDRIVYNGMAVDTILKYPVLGVGIGNFPWVASYLLSKTNFDLRGQPAHHVFLSSWAELGIIGFALTGIMLVFGVEAALRRLTPSVLDNVEQLSRAVLLGGVITLMVIGLLDHYPWTLMQFQALWWGILAVAGSPGIKSAAPNEAQRLSENKSSTIPPALSNPES